MQIELTSHIIVCLISIELCFGFGAIIVLGQRALAFTAIEIGD